MGAAACYLRRIGRFASRRRLKWFKEGDGNTKFFHSVANRRRKINKICELEVDVFKEFQNRGTVAVGINSTFICPYSQN